MSTDPVFSDIQKINPSAIIELFTLTLDNTLHGANTVYSQFMGFDDGPISNNNSNNEVVDGGTTVIEGDTQVVDGGTVGNNQRGEVMAQFDIVKSANSPVAAITISENNSIKELVIGA